MGPTVMRRKTSSGELMAECGTWRIRISQYSGSVYRKLKPLKNFWKLDHSQENEKTSTGYKDLSDKKTITESIQGTFKI